MDYTQIMLEGSNPVGGCCVWLIRNTMTIRIGIGWKCADFYFQKRNKDTRIETRVFVQWNKKKCEQNCTEKDGKKSEAENNMNTAD